jgi:hypothetical protein
MSRALQIFTVLSVLLAAALFCIGVSWSIDLRPYLSGHIDWQEPIQIACMLAVLPLALAGLRRPKFGKWFIAGLAVAAGCLPLTTTSSTGDGTAAELTGSLLFIALPLALIAAVFWRRAKFTGSIATHS